MNGACHAKVFLCQDFNYTKQNVLYLMKFRCLPSRSSMAHYLVRLSL